MSQDQGEYPHYVEGMVLPEGMFPPMKGYTHEDLIDSACNKAFDFLLEKKIEPNLARETIFSLATFLKSAFENEGVENKLATYFKKPYGSNQQKKNNVVAMAQDFCELSKRAAIDSLEGSPVLILNENDLIEFVLLISNDIRDHILKLNDLG